MYATYATRVTQSPRMILLKKLSESTPQILEHTIKEELILAFEETRFHYKDHVVWALVPKYRISVT